MSEALREAFRHNAWATRELLAACATLPEEKLASGSTGTYGGILDTFNHIVSADAGYLFRLAGKGPDWISSADENADLATLGARAAELAELWERLLDEPVDTERVIVVNQGTHEVRAGIFVAQALHHANAHREQICAILTGFGIEPPDVQAWGYAEATGRIWSRSSDQ